MYQALYRKYRPLRFTDVVGQEAVTQTLVGQLTSGKLGHAYLFTGTRGTGKTTCAKILARAVNCEHPVNGDPCNECPSCKGILDGSVTDVFEIDAASNNSVDNVRELREDVVYTPALVKYKVYIIDEVHRMSGPAFDALLKTIEEPPAHVIFILATTELHKVPATILSRCQRFDFRRIDGVQIARRLQEVAAAEGIELTEDAAALLGRMGQGSMRDAMSLLERATALEGTVTAAAVGDLLGLCDPARMIGAVESIASHDIAGTLHFLDDMWRESKDVNRLLSEMAVLLRDIALCDVAPEMVGATRTDEEMERLRAIEQKMTKAGLLGAIETLQKGMRDIERSADARVMTEIMLMRMCDPRLDTSGAALVSRMERLEKAYASLMRTRPQKPNPEPPTGQMPAPPSATPVGIDESGANEPTPPPEESTAPVQAESPVRKEVSTVSKAAPVPATAEESERIWKDTLEVLRVGGRSDLLATLEDLPTPEIALPRVCFRMEDGFARRMMNSEKYKEALTGALERAVGRPCQIHFEDPLPAPRVPDALDELIEVLGDDAEVVD